MATFEDLLSFVFPSTTFMVDTTADPEEPSPVTRRGPGEHVPPGLNLISACHDSSLVDRVLSGLGRGFDKSGKRDLHLPFTTGSYIKGEVSRRGYVIDSVEIRLGRLNLMALQVVDPMIEAMGSESIAFGESTADEKFHPLSVTSREYCLERFQPQSPGPEDDKVFNPVLMHGYMAGTPKTHYEGLPHVPGVDRSGLDADLLDIRAVTATGEQVRLEGAWAIAAKIALQACSSGNCRFAILWALPYFVVTELVLIDGKWHLLISDLCLAVVEPKDSTATPRSLMGVLLGTLMNDFDDYRVEGHSSEGEQRIRNYVEQLEQVPTVEKVQPSNGVPVDPREPTLDVRPPAQSSTTTGDNAAASSSIRGADDTNDTAEGLKVFVKQRNLNVMARHFPGPAVVCDAGDLPDSRMVAVPIELEVGTAPAALSRQPPPAKKICLDSDVPRPKLTEILPRAIQRLFSSNPLFTRAESTFSSPLASSLTSRLDLVRRVGRGASSTVWQAKWVHQSAASPSPSASARKKSPTATVILPTPTPAHETTPTTSPRSLLDVASAPYTSPTPDLQPAMDGPSSGGVGRGKLVAKVVWEEFTPSIAREYFMYTSIVSLLSSKAQEYFPAFYGLYRSGTEGQAYVLVMEEVGSAITYEQLESDAELKAQVDAALKLIADEGLHHNDEGARSVLLRPDGRICLIDWGEAEVR